jgi:hypothetical protein
MKRRREPSVDAEVLAFWRARSLLLDGLLAQSPTSDQSWFWHIQREIVHYLLDRYAGESPAAVPTPEELTRITDLFDGLTPANLEVRSAALLSVDTDAGKSPRPVSDMRPVLAQIAWGNRERYLELEETREAQQRRRLEERKRQFNMVPRRGGSPPMHAAPLHNLIVGTPSALIVNMPEMFGVSDDEIADILSGNTVVEAVPDDAWE